MFGNTTWVPGKIGQAVSFDGAGDYATVPDNAGLEHHERVTMATWVRPDVCRPRSLCEIDERQRQRL